MGIAVIMDIVHSHAVKNEVEGIGNFARDPNQYFYPGGRREHPAWDSLCFDYGKDVYKRQALGLPMKILSGFPTCQVGPLSNTIVDVYKSQRLCPIHHKGWPGAHKVRFVPDGNSKLSDSHPHRKLFR